MTLERDPFQAEWIPFQAERTLFQPERSSRGSKATAGQTTLSSGQAEPSMLDCWRERSAFHMSAAQAGMFSAAAGLQSGRPLETLKWQKED